MPAGISASGVFKFAAELTDSVHLKSGNKRNGNGNSTGMRVGTLSGVNGKSGEFHRKAGGKQVGKNDLNRKQNGII
jgi:hypothetical protein